MECSVCRGSGNVRDEVPTYVTRKCHYCDVSGFRRSYGLGGSSYGQCPDCLGSGRR
jgi:hypothetical protein